jgi:polysaccharide export outer membrane protein
MNNLPRLDKHTCRADLSVRRSGGFVVFGATLAAVCVGSCANLGNYIWVDQYKEPTGVAEKPYTIASGDMIQVRVFNQEQLSARVRVRADGKVSLPLLNDVEAAGYTPVALSQVLEKRLQGLVNAPSVTVSLEETKPQMVMVIGEVTKPGAFPYDPAAGVLQALAAAGGLTPDASGDRIFVLRQAPNPVRIRFSFDRLRRQEGRAATFRLRPGDVVVVE